MKLTPERLRYIADHQIDFENTISTILYNLAEGLEYYSPREEEKLEKKGL